MKSDTGLASFILFPLKLLTVVFIFGLGIFLPLTVLCFRGIPTLLYGYPKTLINVPLALLWFLSNGFIGFKYWVIGKRYLVTGSIHPEYTEEYCKLIRGKWIKSNGGLRTKPRTWKINITKRIKNKSLTKNYPVYNGVTNLMAGPLNYQIDIDLSSIFKGNVPIKGDKICISFKAKANCDMKALRLTVSEKNQKMSEDETLAVTDIKKEIPFSIEKEILVSRNFDKMCSVSVFTNLDEADQEVFLS